MKLRQTASEAQNPLFTLPRNKLARAKVSCVCCVVSFPKFHYNMNGEVTGKRV